MVGGWRRGRARAPTNKPPTPHHHSLPLPLFSRLGVGPFFVQGVRQKPVLPRHAGQRARAGRHVAHDGRPSILPALPVHHVRVPQVQAAVSGGRHQQLAAVLERGRCALWAASCAGNAPDAAPPHPTHWPARNGPHRTGSHQVEHVIPVAVGHEGATVGGLGLGLGGGRWRAAVGAGRGGRARAAHPARLDTHRRYSVGGLFWGGGGAAQAPSTRRRAR